MKQVLGILLVVVLAAACNLDAPPTPTALPPLSVMELEVIIDPKEAATYLLNPKPLSKGDYPRDRLVTIDVLPKQGWQVERWVGPVFNIDGTTAQVKMESSLNVAVRLTHTATANNPSPTMPTQPTTKYSSYTNSIAPKPTARVIRVTATPKPTPWVIRVTPTPKLSNIRRSTPDSMPMTVALNTKRATGWSVTPSAMFGMGYKYYDEGKYNRAIGEFDLVLNYYPNSPQAYGEQGRAYGQLSKHLPAIKAYGKAIKLDPSESVYYGNRGVSYSALGQHRRALDDFNKAINLDPSFALAYYNRGSTHRTLIQYAKADTDWAKACSLDSQYC